MKAILTRKAPVLLGLTVTMVVTFGERSALALNVSAAQKLMAADSGPGDEFGASVDLAGARAVVGAPSHNGALGAAYVFEHTPGGWTQKAKLAAGSPIGHRFFGRDVAASGDTIVVGTPCGCGAGLPGAAYVFVGFGGAWTLEAMLTSGLTFENDSFGSAVDLDGDTLVVGAYGHVDASGASTGAAYVFRRSGQVWSLEAKLEPTPQKANSRFGASVSVHGDTLAVGAPGSQQAGAVFVYERSGNAWTEKATLTAPAPQWPDEFGWSVAIQDGTLLVGSPTGTGGGGEGAVYSYVGSGGTWSLQQKLMGEAPTDQFGHSVALDGDSAVVGAYNATAGVQAWAGAAYQFVRVGGSWSQAWKLEASDPEFGAMFGVDVAIASGTVLAGAARHDAAAQNSGAAYPFQNHLSADTSAISVFSGGTATFTLFGEPGTAYLLGGSASGTSPGFQLSSNVTVPLNMDPLLAAFIVGDVVALFPAGYSGTFDASGVATVQMVIPPNKITLPSDTNIDFAFAAFGVSPSLITVEGASNPVSVTLKD